MNFHYVTLTALQAVALAELLQQYKLDEYAGGLSIELIQREGVSYVEVEFYPEEGDWARWHILSDGNRYIEDQFR